MMPRVFFIRCATVKLADDDGADRKIRGIEVIDPPAYIWYMGKPQAFIISAQASPRILTPFSMASSVELE